MGSLYEKIVREKKEHDEEVRSSACAKILRDEESQRIKDVRRTKMILRSFSLIVSSICVFILFNNNVNQYNDRTVIMNFILIVITLTGIGFTLSNHDGESEVAAAMCPVTGLTGCGYGLWMGLLFSAREYHDAFSGSMTYVISVPMYTILFGIAGLVGGIVGGFIVGFNIK